MVIISMEKDITLSSHTTHPEYYAAMIFVTWAQDVKLYSEKQYSYILHITFKLLVWTWVNYMSKYSNMYCID
jgi:hypothetical protein